MELKRIELMGFKSFPDKTVIEFDHGITAIVGPNGSGKSNIADAVRWVLGEQNARSLRGAKMEDVIFAGTVRRKSLNYAQVILVLDNRDHALNVAYDEISISRTLYRSGESEYTINGGKCRLKDVQELLMDTGIGKEGYSIIGQGQVEKILNGKPQDRREIFEEASGVVKFKTRKQEAESRLAQKDEALVRVNDVLNELSSRLDTLEEEAATAKVYLDYQEELKTYEVSLFLGQYSQYHEQYDKAGANLKELELQLGDVRLKYSEAQERTDKAQKELEEAQAVFKQFDKERQNLQIEREKVLGNIQLIQAKNENEAKEEERLQNALTDAKKRIKNKLEIIGAEKEQLKTLREDQSRSDADKEALIQAQAQAQKTVDEKTAVLEDASAEVEAIKERVSELMTSRERYVALIENAQNAYSEWLKQKDDLSGQLQQGLKSLKEKEKEKAAVQKAMGAASQKVQKASASLAELRAKIREKQDELIEAGQALHEVQSRKKWLTDLENEYEGFAGGVRSVMQWKKAGDMLCKGIIGTVSDLIEVPSQYATAIEIAFGAALQNIVVQSHNDAKTLIEKLRKEQKGRVTFLPLDLVSGREDPHAGKNSLADDVLSLSGVCGFASDLISFDSAYAQVISRLIGNVVVTEDFDSALVVSRAYGTVLRVVTLKGDLFNIGGAITGGSIAQNGNILSRRSELEALTQEEKEASQKVAQISEQAQKLSEKRGALSQELSEQNDLLEKLRGDLDKANDSVREAEFENRGIQNRISDGEENAKILTQSKEEQSEHLASFDEQKQALDQLMDKAVHKQNQAQEDKASAQNAYNEAHDAISAFNVSCAGRISRIGLLEETLTREEEDLSAVSEEADRYLQQMEALRNRPETLARAFNEAQTTLESINAQLQSLEGEAETKENGQSEAMQRWQEAMKAAGGVETQIHDLEKEKLRLEAQLSRAGNDLQVLTDRIWDDYKLTYNAALLLKRDDLGSQSQMKRHVNELKDKIEALGPVNVKALSELVAVKERTEQLTAQRDDIENAAAEIRGIIADLQKKIEEQFSKGFAEISRKFEETFSEMFGGGHAMLKLTEEEDAMEAGVEIIAQPPGKNLQRMMLLSGGERALTAIALLFAVQQLNPAPFCILDEIEAALDDINIARFSAYLQNLCQHTQFILITHRKGTMQAADTLYGITMEEKGVSRCVSVKFQ